jgi:hypothetical protein
MKVVNKGEWYIINDYKHIKNIAIYACKGKEYFFSKSLLG